MQRYRVDALTLQRKRMFPVEKGDEMEDVERLARILCDSENRTMGTNLTWHGFSDAARYILSRGVTLPPKPKPKPETELTETEMVKKLIDAGYTLQWTPEDLCLFFVSPNGSRTRVPSIAYKWAFPTPKPKRKVEVDVWARKEALREGKGWFGLSEHHPPEGSKKWVKGIAVFELDDDQAETSA